MTKIYANAKLFVCVQGGQLFYIEKIDLAFLIS